MDKTQINQIVEPVSSSLKLSDVKESGKYIVFGASGPCGYIDSYKTDKDYIALVKDGAGVGHAYKLKAKQSFLGTMAGLLPKEGHDSKYIYYLIKQLNLGSNFNGTTIPHIYFKNYGKLFTYLRTLEEELAIANELENIEKLIDTKKSQLLALDELIKSRFIGQEVCA